MMEEVIDYKDQTKEFFCECQEVEWQQDESKIETYFKTCL